MGESSDSINGILLENINKKVPINFSLLSTPIKDTPSIRKTSTISKLENYIDENYDEEKKDTLTKEKGHLDELLRSLHNRISSLTGFLREEVKEKNNVIRTLLRRNSCECNSSSPCESLKLDTISEIMK